MRSKLAAAAAIVAVGAAVAGCGLSRNDAAEWANSYCINHGGVNTKSQNGFFYTDHGEGEANVTCSDGTVGAIKSGEGQ